MTVSFSDLLIYLFIFLKSLKVVLSFNVGWWETFFSIIPNLQKITRNENNKNDLFIHLDTFGVSCRLLEISSVEMSAFSQILWDISKILQITPKHDDFGLNCPYHRSYFNTISAYLINSLWLQLIIWTAVL